MIAIASDHGGYDLKERVKKYLEEKNIPYQDMGCDSKASCDYPVFGHATARAVASLPVLCEYCIPFVKKGGSFISMKSAFSDDEIFSASASLRILGGKIESDNVFDLVENTRRRILIIKKISQTPSKYPRASAKISKNPLG